MYETICHTECLGTCWIWPLETDEEVIGSTGPSWCTETYRNSAGSMTRIFAPRCGRRLPRAWPTLSDADAGRLQAPWISLLFLKDLWDHQKPSPMFGSLPDPNQSSLGQPVTPSRRWMVKEEIERGKCISPVSCRIWIPKLPNMSKWCKQFVTRWFVSTPFIQNGLALSCRCTRCTSIHFGAVDSTLESGPSPESNPSWLILPPWRPSVNLREHMTRASPSASPFFRS